ncbi:MAG: hypothetical protein EBZ48_15265, partial [Proteobacteria bacterium]|nr:hypothetical protein [Pseudomonadota bacterium]
MEVRGTIRWLTRATLLGLFLVALCSCSSTNVSGSMKGKEAPSLSLLALLPVRIDGDISRERAQEVHRRVEAELRGRGYLLIDGGIVARVCKAPECPNRTELFSDFGAQALVINTVTSVARTNFLAGYVNSVSGSISFMGPAGTELLSVRHSKRERGGLLFNTGQLAEGLIQTARNANSEESFGVLAGLYAKELLDEVPHGASKGETAEQPMAAVIRKTTVIQVQDGAHRVCLLGTPASLAAVVYRKLRTTLREVSPGEYCGVFYLSDYPQPEALEVELRSAYGDAAREPLHIGPSIRCSFADSARVSAEGSQVKIQVSCEGLKEYSRVLVYRAPVQFGVFEKIGELSGKNWTGQRI